MTGLDLPKLQGRTQRLVLRLLVQIATDRGWNEVERQELVQALRDSPECLIKYAAVEQVVTDLIPVLWERGIIDVRHARGFGDWLRDSIEGASSIGVDEYVATRVAELTPPSDEEEPSVSRHLREQHRLYRRAAETGLWVDARHLRGEPVTRELRVEPLAFQLVASW